MRVSAFIDGFNLYHAIDDLGRDELKWVNLRALIECFTKPDVHDLGSIYYFSAYCYWNQDKRARHIAYVRALKHYNVEPVMGNFKPKDQECRNCGDTWESHEEKQSDVNLAISLIREAHLDSFDRAYVVTSDSDFVPAFTLVGEIFPDKSIKVICPPGRFHSKEICAAAKNRAKVKVEHLEKCLLPEDLATMTGLVTRPALYNP